MFFIAYTFFLTVPSIFQQMTPCVRDVGGDKMMMMMMMMMI
jgi:hypothetical protein